jgi:hypothetical protein
MWIPSTRTGQIAALAVAAVLIGLVSGCGGEDRSAGPERVTVQDVEERQYFYEGE